MPDQTTAGLLASAFRRDSSSPCLRLRTSCSRPAGWYPDRVIGFIVLGVLVAVVVLGFVANSRWAAKRGWVFNKHNPRPRGSATPMLLDQIYQPSIEHTIEEEASEATRADQDESGDKPNLG